MREFKLLADERCAEALSDFLLDGNFFRHYLLGCSPVVVKRNLCLVLVNVVRVREYFPCHSC